MAQRTTVETVHTKTPKWCPAVGEFFTTDCVGSGETSVFMRIDRVEPKAFWAVRVHTDRETYQGRQAHFSEGDDFEPWRGTITVTEE